VIDGATNKVTATIPVGNAPYWVASDPATNTVYITNYENNTGAMLETCGSAGKGVSAKEGVPSRMAES
jgi:DNA-binding beta-propeller fold protein YncE